MEYLYEERTPKAWTITCVAIYVVGVGWMGVMSLPEDLGAWLAVSAMFLLVLGPCLGVPVSKFIYHRIQLTPETLRVGRERIPVADLDSESIRAAHRATTPAMAQRVVTSLSTNDIPVPGPRFADLGGPRLVGGAWGVPMGMDSVVIITRGEEPLCIATRDRTSFLTALIQAIGQPPGTETGVSPVS